MRWLVVSHVARGRDLFMIGHGRYIGDHPLHDFLILGLRLNSRHRRLLFLVTLALAKLQESTCFGPLGAGVIWLILASPWAD
jgi:hypothetical protein